MARSFDDERKAIEADERKLAERRKALEDRQRKAMMKVIGKSELARIDPSRLERFLARVTALGMDEVETRLAS